MHGILRPSQSYSPIAPAPRRVSFADAQQQQQQWARAQPDSSYYPPSAPYATPSYTTPHHKSTSAYTATPSSQLAQPYGTQSASSYETPAEPAAAYTNPTYPSSMAHSTPATYPSYSPTTNLYQNPSASPSQPAPFESPASDESDEPSSAPQKRQRTSNVYGLKYNFSAPDIESLIVALGTDIEANAGNEVCTSTELSLQDSAMVPLLRPAIGPYSVGGDQDIPADFEMTWPENAQQDGESEGQLQSQTQTQPDSQPTTDTSASQSQPTTTTDSQSQISSNLPPPRTHPRRPDPDSLPSAPRARISSTLTVPSYKSRSIIQRAASRGLIQAIENFDGYKYSFNNAWSAKDQDGYRFSYICQDSMQNKDRHANGFPRTVKGLKGGSGEGRGPRKATYDCKGSVSVKFSARIGAVVVQYRHAAIHGTVAERRPPPRIRNKGVPDFAAHGGEGSVSRGVPGMRGMNTPRGSAGFKRKRELEPAGPTTGGQVASREPSLFDLLCRSAEEDLRKGRGG